jgi:hypothetical protein
MSNIRGDVIDTSITGLAAIGLFVPALLDIATVLVPLAAVAAWGRFGPYAF